MRIQIRFHEPKFTKKAMTEFKKSALLETRIDYLIWVLDPKILISPEGLFLTKHYKKSSITEYRKLIKDRGKFNAEGIVNHIHLDHVTRNPVWQYEIGLRAIKSWNAILERSGFNGSTVIYLNEYYETSRRVNYTLCIYSNPAKNELIELENHWRREVKVLSFKQFMKWGKTEYNNWR